MSYKMLTVRGVPGIKCLECKLISHSEVDIRQKYCGNCHKFHGGNKNVET